MSTIDTFELKKEQYKLASKVQLRDGFDKIKTVAGISTVFSGDNILACVVVCELPSLKVLEKQTYLLSNPLPYQLGYLAYRDMPAMIEAYNLLEEEPDVIFVEGSGINHPRRIGLASHLGLALNKSTIGVTQKLTFGQVNEGKIIFNNEVSGFEIKTREHANPIYISPGHLVTLGSSLDLIKRTIQYPHKMPEPLHLAHKIAKKKIKEKNSL